MVCNDTILRNIQYIKNAFPECIVECVDKGKMIEKIDFEMLCQLLSDSVINEKEERYQFSWPNKKNVIAETNKKTTNTLRPIENKSVDFANTENLYIEGDNLEVLKLLQETYLGQIRIIYIDPPYNTGNDLIYDDKYAKKIEEYVGESGQYDDNGNQMVANLESNGRFHTDWLNMMYPRLRLAKTLLSEKGIIIVSIGQAELANVIKMCDEIYGEKNRAGVVSRQMKTGNNQGKFFTQNTDYMVVYAKNADEADALKDDMSEELIEKVYTKVQESGPRKGERYRTMGLFQASLKHGGSTYPIECPDGTKVITPDGLPWRWNEKTFLKGKENDDVVFIKTKTSPLINLETGEKAEWNIYTKIWLSSRMEEGQLPSDLILKFENRHAAKELVSLDIPFDFPKPTSLIKYILHLVNDKDYIVLDFFSGSGTTAEAVMQLNAEDNGKRKYIMVQCPEHIDEKTIAYKKGFTTICEIGEERIRRAAKKIREESGKEIDYGFRTLKIDTSNMKDVYYNPSETQQSLFDTYVDNIKEDRTPEDLLFQVMLNLGVLLSSKIEETRIAGKQVFNVADGFLIACFDKDVTEETVKAVAEKKPYYAVFRDSSMANDSVATNFDQIFESISPDTVRKVL